MDIISTRSLAPSSPGSAFLAEPSGLCAGSMISHSGLAAPRSPRDLGDNQMIFSFAAAADTADLESDPVLLGEFFSRFFAASGEEIGEVFQNRFPVSVMRPRQNTISAMVIACSTSSLWSKKQDKLDAARPRHVPLSPEGVTLTFGQLRDSLSEVEEARKEVIPLCVCSLDALLSLPDVRLPAFDSAQKVACIFPGRFVAFNGENVPGKEMVLAMFLGDESSDPGLRLYAEDAAVFLRGSDIAVSLCVDRSCLRFAANARKIWLPKANPQ